MLPLLAMMKLGQEKRRGRASHAMLKEIYGNNSEVCITNISLASIEREFILERYAATEHGGSELPEHGGYLLVSLGERYRSVHVF